MVVTPNSQHKVALTPSPDSRCRQRDPCGPFLSPAAPRHTSLLLEPGLQLGGDAANGTISPHSPETQSLHRARPADPTTNRGKVTALTENLAGPSFAYF